MRLRETGRVLQAEVAGAAPKSIPDLAEMWPGDADRAWRFAQLSFVPNAKPQDSTARGAKLKSKRSPSVGA